MCQCGTREKQDVLRRIKATGCPIELEVPTVEARGELTISQTGDASIFDMGDCGAGLSLWMRFAREKPGLITIAEFGDVFAPWGALSAIWLDPRPQSGQPFYCLPNGFEFPCDDVLNGRLRETGLCLRAGRLAEGFVLGSTQARIPARYSHGCLVEAEFSLRDGLDREFRGQVRLVVDRSTATARRPRRAQPSGGLYAPNERPRKWEDDHSSLAEPLSVMPCQTRGRPAPSAVR